MRSVLLRHLSLALMVLATTIACAPTGGPDASGRYTLTMADLYSMQHSIGTAGVQPFMELVTEKSGGRIEFDYRPAEQMLPAADIHRALKVDAVDAGNILYMGSQNQLLHVAQLPGLFADDDVVAASRAFWEFVRTNKTVQDEFAWWNIRPLFCFTVSNYQLQFADRSIDSIEDLDGKQIRAAGSVLPFSIRAVGASPVDIHASETYDAFNRGVVDGLSLSVTSVADYAFYELIESSFVNVNLGGFPVCYGINADVYDSLPADLRQVVDEAGDATVSDAASRLHEQIAPDIESWREMGMDVHEITITQDARDRLAGVEQEWTDQLVGDGMDRSAAEGGIAEFKRLLVTEVSGGQ